MESFFKTHLQMALSVQTMITVRQVGITYDRFGMVTMRSFVAVRVFLRLSFVCFLFNYTVFDFTVSPLIRQVYFDFL